MGKPTSVELARLAAEVAVERLVEERGIAMASEGPRLVGVCPWCEQAGGLTVDREANTFSCSGCDAGGGPVEWVVAIEGVSLAHAVELLREGMPLTTALGPPPKVGTRRLLPGLPVGLPDDALLAEVVAFYHRTLLESPEPAAFLERRDLADSAMVEAFRFGFSDRSLSLRVADRHRADGKVLRPQLQSMGVFSPKSGHEAFRGSLVVPVVDIDGRVVQLYGRKIGQHLRAGTRLHTWLNGDRPLFNVTAVQASTEIIVAGSVLDALSWWRAGFGNVVAVDGPEGFDRNHLDTLISHEVTRVLIAFGRDDAGEAGAAGMAKRLLTAGVECFRVGFPAGMDGNDYLRASAQPTDALAKAIRGALWCGKGPAPGRRHTPNPAPPAATPMPDPPTPTGEATSVVEDQCAAEQLDEDLADAHAEVEPAVDGDSDDDSDLDANDDEGEDAGVWASPVPAPAADEPSVVFDGDAMRMAFGERRWRVRNLERNTSFDVLRVQVLVSVAATPRGPGFHMDSFDLYSARARGVFLRDAAVEVGVDKDVLKGDLGAVLWAAESIVEEAIRQAQTPAPARVELDADERTAALGLLTDRHLVDRITEDFARAGMVGESMNCLVGYLAVVSRMLERPLAVIVQSTSAAGKSALMDAVLDFVPEEDRVAFSAMTGQSLYYMGERDLAHKVLAIAEEEGAERASYALKLLQSEGQLSIASTGKDTSTGRLTTHPYHVEGPAAILLTTTAIDVDEELLNRCIVLTVNEDQGQTRAIHDRQRSSRTLAGILAANERDAVLKVHQDAQRLLDPVTVVNPFADRLGFTDGTTRTRRDHVKYLTLIETIALIHQHQRIHHTAVTRDGRTITYIDATLEDIALANTLAHEVLGRSLDELPPQTRRLLDALDEMVAAIANEEATGRDRVRFTRRQVRERTGLGDTQLKIHLARLVDLEFVWAHRAERAGAFIYELAWDGTMSDRRRFLPGLVDVSALRNNPPHPDESTAGGGVEACDGAVGGVGDTSTDAVRSGQPATRSGPDTSRSGAGRASRPGRSGSGRTPRNGVNGQANGHKPAPEPADGPDSTVGGARKRAGRSGAGAVPAPTRPAATQASAAGSNGRSAR